MLQTLSAWLDHEAKTSGATPRFDLRRHERTPTLPSNHRVFDLLGRAHPCPSLLPLGQARRQTQEVKHVCRPPPGPCSVMSIGSGHKYGFEHDVLDELRCNVTTFDCTVDEPVVLPAALRGRLPFVHECLGTPPLPTRTAFLYAPNQTWSKRYFKKEHLAPSAFRSYEALVARMHGGALRAPTIVKMDAEGYEWDELPHIVQSAWRPRQLQFELHLGTQMPGLSWFGRTKSEAEVLALSQLLREHGYRLAHREDNPWCSKCTEVLYLDTRYHNVSRRGVE